MASTSVLASPPSGNRQDVAIFVGAFTTAVTGICVGARLYTRKYMLNQVGADDYWAIVSFLLVFATAFSTTYNVKFGLGLHFTDVQPSDIFYYKRTMYVSIVMYNAALFAIKVTFLVQYRRIFNHTSRAIGIFFTFCWVFIVAWSVAQLLASIFVCTPVSGYWDMTVQARCIPSFPLWQINASGNIFSDVLIFLMPIPVVGGLHLPRRQRYMLIGIFSLGLFTVCIGLIRIRFLRQYQDFTWENVEAAGWSEGEVASGLTTACLPTLRPLVGRLFPWIGSHSAHYGRYGGGPYEADLVSSSRNNQPSHRQHTVEKGDDVELGSPSSGLGNGGRGNRFTDRTADDGNVTDNDEWLLTETPSVTRSSTAAGSLGLEHHQARGNLLPGDGWDGDKKNAVSSVTMASLVADSDANRINSSSGQKKPEASQWLSQDSVRPADTAVQTKITTPAPVALAGGRRLSGDSLPPLAIRVERQFYQTDERWQ